MDWFMLKTMVRSLAHFSGYEIMSLERAQADRRCVAKLLKEEQVNLVVDVGANLGQFAGWIREIGYRGRIISFEPLAEAHQKARHGSERRLFLDRCPEDGIGR